MPTTRSQTAAWKKGTVHATARLEPSSGIQCPNCKQLLPRSKVRDVWVEIPHKQEGLIAAYRILPENGAPAIAEVRLFPFEAEREAGEWSHDPAIMPSGGLTSSALRSLRLSDAQLLFQEVIRNWDKLYGKEARAQVFKRHGLSRAETPVRRRPGRKGRSDLYFAVWAAAYVDLVERGIRTPIKELAANPPLPLAPWSLDGKASRHTIADIVAEARTRGLLTAPALPGRAGGELTERAKRLLGTPKLKAKVRTPGRQAGP